MKGPPSESLDSRCSRGRGGLTDGVVARRLRACAWTLCAVVVALLANWLYGFWAFHLVGAKALPRQKGVPSAPPPRVSFEWGAPHDFPEDFGPLIALKQLIARGEAVATRAIVEMTSLLA